jgi:dTDP-4-dehydrorhamnose 3,5-epimerase-like enzyme
MDKKKYSVDDVNIVNIQNISDKRGVMSVVTNKTSLFDIKRVFSIQANKCDRGHHAHKLCKQFIVCLTGSIKVIVKDGLDQKEFILNSSLNGLYIPSGIWSYQIYEDNFNIVNVYCDLDYDESDYIRDFQEYLLFIKKSN